MLDDSDFQNLLRDLADKYLAGEHYIRKKQLIDLLPFATEHVVEELRTSGVFLENNGRYEVQRQHLVLGLAFVLVDQVEVALHGGRDLTETIAGWLEPHAAMDIKAQICEAAALRALHIPDFPVSAKAALLRAWMISQNVGQQVERNMSAYFPIDPQSYFELAERIWCELIDHRWGQKVLMNIFLRWIAQQNDARLPLWRATFQRWLGFVPRSGYPFLGRRTDEKKLKVQQAIAERLGFELQPGPFALGGYQLTAIDDDGLLRLGRAALALISHVPREPFIHAIATGCVAEAINDYPNKYSEFAWVIRTSQQPLWNAVQVEVEYLLGSHHRIAQQAAYHLLSFVGSTEARDLQATLPQDLFPPHPAVERHAVDPCVSVFSWSREDCERCVARTDIASDRIAHRIQPYCIDPNLQVPEDLGTRLAPLAETIDVQSMHTGTWHTSADHTFEEYEPALCAYAPEGLANVVHRLVRQITEREGMALRQLSIFLKDYSIILTQEELHSIYQVWSTLQQPSTSGDENAEDAEMFLFFRVLQYLDAHSQLTHVLSRPREALDLINYEHYFLPITDWGSGSN